VISAPKATINNYGNFKQISIHDGKTVYDRGTENNIVVRDSNSLKLVAGKQSSNTTVSIVADGAKVTLVNNGEISGIRVKSESTVTLRGNATEAPSLNVTGDASIKVQENTKVGVVTINSADAKVSLDIAGSVEKVVLQQKADITISGTTDSVAIQNDAAGSTISSTVKADVQLNADASVSFEKGAEGSSVTTGSADVAVNVNNNTDATVTMTDSNGQDSTIAAGQTSETATPSTGNTSTGSSESAGGSGSGGSTGGTAGSTSASNPFNVTKTEYKVTDDALLISIYMNETPGVSFTIGGMAADGTPGYENGAYTFSFGKYEGRYVIGISTSSKSQTVTVVYDNTAPVITLDAEGENVNVFVSDADSWEPFASAYDTVDGDDITFSKSYAKVTDDGNTTCTLSQARQALKTLGTKIKVTYTATDSQKNTKTETQTFTSVADVKATSVTISGTYKVGETLAAVPKNGSTDAGGGLSYQWLRSSEKSGSYEEITGATDADYVLKTADYEKYIKVQITNKGEDVAILSAESDNKVGKGDLTIGDLYYDYPNSQPLANGSTPEITRVHATVVNSSDEVIVTDLAFAEDYSELEENTTVKITATADGANTDFYNVADTSLKILVRGSLTQEEAEAAFADPSNVTNNMLKFKTAEYEYCYDDGNNVWIWVSDGEFSCEKNEILVRKISNDSKFEPSVAVKVNVSSRRGTKDTEVPAPEDANDE
jgi:hypothetical protein